ncbi:MAG: hypothetical protein E6649_03060 [Paeniclostridium sordellii]|nr:hypothetical protein [Paeniclostridium sordellii]
MYSTNLSQVGFVINCEIKEVPSFLVTLTGKLSSFACKIYVPEGKSSPTLRPWSLGIE